MAEPNACGNTAPIDHWNPADCIGDAGAAMGALLLAWASVALAKQYTNTERVLVWGASDDGLKRGCNDGACWSRYLMPSNIVVNKMSTQHKASIGMASAFPDVCKTPAPPAPAPVPIPYPNIAMSTMASLKTSKRVKDNKQKVVVKGSAYSLSNGDQPGVAMGVVSNKIMGKSYIKNQSFNVKFEKKGVGRLMDPHGNNSGSNPNGIAPAEGQPPMIAEAPTIEAMLKKRPAERWQKKQIPEEDLDKAYHEHGMSPEHGRRMRAYCKDNQSISGEGNVDCIKKIEMGFGGKPGNLWPIAKGTDTRRKACSGAIGMPVRDAKGDKVPGADWMGLSSTKRGDNGYIPASEVKDELGKRGESGLMDWLMEEGALTGDYDMHTIC